MEDYGEAMIRNQNIVVQARTKAQNRPNVLQLKVSLVIDSEIQALVDVKAEEPKKNPDCFGVFCLPYDVKAMYGDSPLSKISLERKFRSSNFKINRVVEKPAPVKISPLLTSRHLSQRRLRLPVRKYHPKTDGLKVAFFNDDEDTPSTPKAYALFVPRENPIALVIRPFEQWHSRSGMAKTMANGTPVHENGKVHHDVYNFVNGHQTKDKDGFMVLTYFFETYLDTLCSKTSDPSYQPREV
ncbi:hypothetical protein OROMI_011674 [Orobanche minor]